MARALLAMSFASAWKRSRSLVISNGLPEIEVTEDRYSSMNSSLLSKILFIGAFPVGYMAYLHEDEGVYASSVAVVLDAVLLVLDLAASVFFADALAIVVALAFDALALADVALALVAPALVEDAPFAVEVLFAGALAAVFLAFELFAAGFLAGAAAGSVMGAALRTPVRRLGLGGT